MCRNVTFTTSSVASTRAKISRSWTSARKANSPPATCRAPSTSVRGIIERDIERVLPDGHTPIVLYCGGGYRSVLVADSIQKMGYRNVVSMDGGWRAWIAADYETEEP